MKNIKKRILLVTFIALSMSSHALLPVGWSFECIGSTGHYSGPNGSSVTVPGHWAC